LNAEHMAKLFKILGDDKRLRILLCIGKNRCSVSEIIGNTSFSQTLVSFHLRILREACILKAERQGAFIYYQLVDAELLDLVSKFNEFVSKMPLEIREEEYSCPCPPTGNNILTGRYGKFSNLVLKK